MLKAAVEALANAPRSADSFEALDALKNLHDVRLALRANWDSPEAITRRLAEAVWYYTFMHYYWLEEQRKNTSGKT